MSVKERIAMMSANKGSSPSSISTTSNPASNGPRTSVADRLAAMKANSTDPSPAKQQILLSTPQKSANIENPIGRECVSNPATAAANITIPTEVSLENKGAEGETKQRRGSSTIADRIAALNKPQDQQPAVQPFSPDQLRPKPAAVKTNSTLVAEEATKEKVSSNSPSISASIQPPAAVVAHIPPEQKQPEVSGEDKMLPVLATPQKETAVVAPVAAVTPTSSSGDKPSSSGGNSGGGGVAAKIAAMKNGLPIYSPPTDAAAGSSNVRRMSADMKTLGAKINLGGLIPGAPRPVPKPHPSAAATEDDDSSNNNNSNTASKRPSLSLVEGDGELRHVSLSRPGVNANRKRAVSSVKLSAAWKQELEAEDTTTDIMPKRSLSTASASAAGDMTTASTLSAAVAGVTMSDNNDTTTTTEL